jgi:hypothetical protein
MPMSEFLSETEGCDLLTRLFRARGYSIARNQLFHEYGVEFHIDGWDAKARVGFEFLTSEDDDHDDLSLVEYQALWTAQQLGELALFIIDEVEPLSAADLTATANEFLDEVAEAVKARRLVAPRKKTVSVAKKTATREGAVKVQAVAKKKTSATKPVNEKVAKKKVAKKKVAKK